MYPYQSDEKRIFSTESAVNVYNEGDLTERLRRFFAENEKEGYLSFQISTAQSALPVKSAKVIITKDLGGGYGVTLAIVADASGNIRRISLPAPSRAKELSKSGGTPHPYAAYDVQISAPEYVTKRLEDIAIIEGITSLQPVELQPALLRNASE